jgi:hypothetical protein
VLIVEDEPYLAEAVSPLTAPGVSRELYSTAGQHHWGRSKDVDDSGAAGVR